MAVRISIIDYGCGNIRSVVNALKVAGALPELITSPEQLRHADKIILPGVGAFEEAIASLRARGFIEALECERARGKTMLGICLGMQLMCRESDENGRHLGLGWVEADVRHFRALGVQDLKVPHMGWNSLEIMRRHPLMRHIDQGTDVYFVHSHAVQCDDPNDVLCHSEYGVRFVSAFAHEQVMGMQFHPEKSDKAGLRMIRNFVEL
jgi:glutamine amidotransferase